MDELALIADQLRDVTDLRSMLEGLFVHSPVAFQLYRADGRSILVNPAFLRLFGAAPPPEYNVFEDTILEQQGFLSLVRRAFAGEVITVPPHWYDPRALENVVVHEARRVGIQVTLFPLFDNSTRVVRHVAVCAKDVTSELELAQREERLRQAFDAGRMVAWDTNLADRRVHVSDNAREVLGLGPDTPLATIDDAAALVHPDDLPALRAAFASARQDDQVADLRLRMLRSDTGEVRWFEQRSRVVREAPSGVPWLRGLLIDVTERVRADEALRASEEALRGKEEQLRQSQKLEAVGRLAGGVAHDFNNLLSIVLSYSELLLSGLPPQASERADLEAIRRAGQRAADLTSQLLAFSRQQVLDLRVLDVNEIVRAADNMLGRLLGEDVELACRTGAEPLRVRADAGQLEQVILNLAINARDAMPEGGKLTLETESVVLDGASAGAHLGVAPGRYVVLTVSDTGMGMDRETQSRIFEPFFTTKERGKGTGLGLSMVFGIVQQSGGSIWVYSEPGAGAVFKVYLPAVEEAEAPRAAVPVPATLRGDETILLVEDQAEVREVAREILRRAGYLVLCAASAPEALALSAAHADVIHLLLTDVVMPQMSGGELADRLRPLRPAMRVLFMSGYTEDATVRPGVLAKGAAYLQKPLVPDTLARRVREVLDQ